MNVEYLHDNRNGVDEHGDVVSLYDLEWEDAATQLDNDVEATYVSSIENTIRNHPAAHDIGEPEISKLAQELINELRQQHKRRRKARAIFAVLRTPGLSPEDRSAIAIEAGLPINVFEKQPEDLSVPTLASGVIMNTQGPEQQQDSDFTDVRKAAANDRD
jgi:hypothetical protein